MCDFFQGGGILALFFSFITHLFLGKERNKLFHLYRIGRLSDTQRRKVGGKSGFPLHPPFPPPLSAPAHGTFLLSLSEKASFSLVRRILESCFVRKCCCIVWNGILTRKRETKTIAGKKGSVKQENVGKFFWISNNFCGKGKKRKISSLRKFGINDSNIIFHSRCPHATYMRFLGGSTSEKGTSIDVQRGGDGPSPPLLGTFC